MRAALLPGLMILSSLSLTGCAPQRLALAAPPAHLLTCADEPLAPDLPGRDQQLLRDALMIEYTLGLRSAWGSCHAAVAGIRAWAVSPRR